MAYLAVFAGISFALVFALKSPSKALTAAVFFAPWAGVDVDVGLRVTAYLIFTSALLAVYLISLTSSRDARSSRFSNRLLWFVLVYAVLWTLIQIPFMDDLTISGGALRSPQLRAISQVIMFLITISPIFVVPWALRDIQGLQRLARTYLISVVSLAIIGWLQLLIWVGTGSDPLPIGFIHSLLQGETTHRSGVFNYGGAAVYRMSSFGGEPKSLGVGFAVGLLLLQAGVRLRDRWAAAVWPLLFCSMIATFSTMAMLAWFGASLVQLVFRDHKVHRGARMPLVVSTRSLYVVLLCLILLPAAFFVFPGSKLVGLIEQRTIGRVTADSRLSGATSGVLEDFNVAVLGFLESSPAYIFVGVGLGNVHLHADVFLPPDAARYASGTPFVAKSYLLRWVSELGVFSLLMFLYWWTRVVLRAKAVSFRTGNIECRSGVIQPLCLSVIAFWLVSGYITPQFFLLTGAMLAIARSRQNVFPLGCSSIDSRSNRGLASSI